MNRLLFLLSKVWPAVVWIAIGVVIGIAVTVAFFVHLAGGLGPRW